MKLTIFGKHPIPQGGFNGVMSLFEAIGFSRLGYEVTLAIPFESHEEHVALLEKNKITDLNTLNKFGGNFKITPVFPDGENFEHCDILVYQSYFKKDFDLFWDLCCKKSKFRTKNYPKFVTYPDALREKGVVGQFAQFHFVACALKEDVNLLNSDIHFKNEFANCYSYVPRGANSELLHPGFKSGIPPSIGIDMPNGLDLTAISHYFEPLSRLKNEFPELRIFSIGKAIAEIDSIRIPFGRFDDIYNRFFNQIHLYLTINYEFSPKHLNARVQQKMPEWRRKAIYEVQNIEAQMSGAALIGHRDNLISELYEPGQTGLNFDAYENAENIYNTLKFGIVERHNLSRQARSFAKNNFEWNNCIKMWSDGLQLRIKS